MTDSTSDQGGPEAHDPEPHGSEAHAPNPQVSGLPGSLTEVPDPPSKARLAWATLAALLVAGVVLVSTVLPAEYDIDPLGIGQALGLRVLSAPGVGPIAVREDGLSAYRSSYRTELRTFELEPGGWVEYKYRLEAGRTMVYSWSATSWVRSEMHSEADTSPVGTAEFFEVAEETLARHGSYLAPFPGIHGWYWLNEGEAPLTVTLYTAGFYTTSTEFLEGVAPIVREITETPDSTAYRPYF